MSLRYFNTTLQTSCCEWSSVTFSLSSQNPSPAGPLLASNATSPYVVKTPKIVVFSFYRHPPIAAPSEHLQKPLQPDSSPSDACHKPLPPVFLFRHLAMSHSADTAMSEHASASVTPLNAYYESLIQRLTDVTPSSSPPARPRAQTQAYLRLHLRRPAAAAGPAWPASPAAVPA